jgi:hypothetical protein
MVNAVSEIFTRFDTPLNFTDFNGTRQNAPIPISFTEAGISIFVNPVF